MRRNLAFLTLIFTFFVSTIAFTAQNENFVKSFVYKWFAQFDVNAPMNDFLRFLPSKFSMKFPEATLRNHSDFSKWYSGILATIKSANHEIRTLKVSKKNNMFHVEVAVLWTATTKNNQNLSFDAFQTWKITINKQGIPQILEYNVSDGKGYKNHTRQKVKYLNEPVFGGFVTIGSHKIIENLALSRKLDFVWLEAEHTEFSPETVQNLTVAAENEGLTSIVRVPENNFNLIKKYIGTGVRGIIVPSIKTAKDAENAIKAIKYSPIGNRAAGAERGNRYLGNFSEYMRTANDEILAILMIETKEAVENIDEIAKVKGIDILHMGPYDLSLSFGVPMTDVKLKTAIRKVESIAAKYSIPLGSYAPTMEAARNKMKLGYSFFTIPGDMEMLQSGVKNFFK